MGTRSNLFIHKAGERFVREDGSAIDGLDVIEEITGNLHRSNRLGESAVLGFAVLGKGLKRIFSLTNK